MTRWEKALRRLQQGPACGNELFAAGAGYRYSARIGDLREKGHEIDSDHRCRRHSHDSGMVEYVLEGWDDRQGTLL